LRAIQGFRGAFAVQCALRLAPFFFVRPGELRRAEWKDIDFDKAEWRYFVTKTKTEHSVPLATQVVSILRELRSTIDYFYRIAIRVLTSEIKLNRSNYGAFYDIQAIKKLAKAG
jgi:integrase